MTHGFIQSIMMATVTYVIAVSVAIIFHPSASPFFSTWSQIVTSGDVMIPVFWGLLVLAYMVQPNDDTEVMI